MSIDGKHCGYWRLVLFATGGLIPCCAIGQVTGTETIVLDQIVVSATGFEQNLKDAPASITVVTREDLESGAFRDLTDALKEVQGVTVTGAPNEQDIFIRGLPGAYTLILVDGKRQSTRDARTNGNSGFEQSFVPPLAAIERIEVIRGPMSSLYGSDAMGGVINIITRRQAASWSGTVSVDGTIQQNSESGNSGQAQFYASGPIVSDVLGLQVWGRGYKRGEDDQLAGINAAEEFDLTGRLTFTPDENHDFALEAGRTRVRRDSSDGYTLADGSADDYNLNNRDHWSLSHTGRWGWTTSDIYISQEWAQRESYSENLASGDFDKNARAPEIRNTVVDGKLTTPFDLFGNHTLVVGGQWQNALLTDFNPGLRTNENEEFEIDQSAVFAEDEWWIWDNFSLTSGLRMDQHEVYGSHFSPRLYAVWHATQALTLKGGVSTGFRAPEIRQIAPGYAYTTGGRGCYYGPQDERPDNQSPCGVMIADPGLAAETSTSYEAAVLWQPFGTLQLGATYFYTDFVDKIASARVFDENGDYVYWDEDPYYSLFYHYNIDDAVIQGVELTASWEATQTLSLRASYTYTDSEQTTGDYAGLPLARTPEHLANIRADWITPVEGLSSWVSANYHGEEINAGLRIGSNGDPVTDGSGAILARKYDAYYTIDTGLSYEINDTATFNAAIYNVFDEVIDTEDFNAVNEGRRLWVGLNMEF